LDDGEFFGNRIEQGQSLVRAHPDVVSLVDVDGGDFLAGQRIRVGGVGCEIPDFIIVDGQYAQTVEHMTDVEFPVLIVRHAPNVVAHHARYGGLIEMPEGLGPFIHEVHTEVIGADPKLVFGGRCDVGHIVGDDGVGIRRIVGIVGEFLGFGVEGVQAGSLSGNPNGVVRTVRIDLIQFIAVDAAPFLAVFAVYTETVPVEPVQPRFGGEPHVTLLVLRDAHQVAVGQTLFHSQLFDCEVLSKKHQRAKEKEKQQFRFHRQVFKIHPVMQN